MAASGTKALGMSGMPPELSALMQRYIQLGRLLPQGDEITRAVALEDAETRAECVLVLNEMAEVKERIDDFIAANSDRRAGAP
jgi:hypothetical protein